MRGIKVLGFGVLALVLAVTGAFILLDRVFLALFGEEMTAIVVSQGREGYVDSSVNRGKGSFAPAGWITVQADDRRIHVREHKNDPHHPVGSRVRIVIPPGRSIGEVDSFQPWNWVAGVGYLGLAGLCATLAMRAGSSE